MGGRIRPEKGVIAFLGAKPGTRSQFTPDRTTTFQMRLPWGAAPQAGSLPHGGDAPASGPLLASRNRRSGPLACGCLAQLGLDRFKEQLRGERFGKDPFYIGRFLNRVQGGEIGADEGREKGFSLSLAASGSGQELEGRGKKLVYQLFRKGAENPF